MSAVSSDALGTDRGLGPAVYRDEDFPGRESFHLPASGIDRYEGRRENVVPAVAAGITTRK